MTLNPYLLVNRFRSVKHLNWQCCGMPGMFRQHFSQSCVYCDETTNTSCKALETLNFKMSLDASDLKNLCLWSEFHLPFIISLLLKSFQTALRNGDKWHKDGLKLWQRQTKTQIKEENTNNMASSSTLETSGFEIQTRDIHTPPPPLKGPQLRQYCYTSESFILSLIQYLSGDSSLLILGLFTSSLYLWNSLKS